MIQFADGRHDQLVQRPIGRPVHAWPSLQVQVRTRRAIQHPQRHLQPRPVLAPDQSAPRHVFPAPSRRLHADLAAKQRMPAIPHLPRARPAGIMLYGCSTSIAHTKDWATAHWPLQRRGCQRNSLPIQHRRSVASAANGFSVDCCATTTAPRPEPSSVVPTQRIFDHDQV
jgi:hypothetical protein